MKYRNTHENYDWEKKLKRSEKGTKKVEKYRKSLYNLLLDYDEEYFDDESDNEINVRGNQDYVKR